MRSATSAEDLEKIAPGVTVVVRDESWLVTDVATTTDGLRIKVRGLSDFVRDTTATYFTALDAVQVADPTAVHAKVDRSEGFRHSKLWLESTMRQTPVAMHSQTLEVATQMLADPLDYQLDAVRRALDPKRLRTRVLLADAVGLGKTLEIGMIVAELIRRGRGARILVVTPRHVLEQFQQEMWARFAIPLVRLDSVGIQKVRQKLPASRNPFTYFPRVIVSMDTLKQPKYRAQLEKVKWDIVVVDEIHNATNVGTGNNALVRTLAPRTDSLILASATPHNGDPRAFMDLLRMLDPLAVKRTGEPDMEVARDLIIRRHRYSPEVANVVGGNWAVREEPRNILVAASEEEDAVANEIRDVWLTPGAMPDNHLFPWTLVKAFLSSPAALEESIEARLNVIAGKVVEGKSAEPTDGSRDRKERMSPAEAARQTAALNRLRELNAKVTPEKSEKYAALADYLVNEVGISKKSKSRAVVFSERVKTLKFLQENLSRDLGLPDGAVKVMSGKDLSDTEQMALIDEFKRTDTPLRILVTGDVASEGVNLHAQCHDLIHYDIPWSLIRIQQRNGRIDRYGQKHPPRIASLLLDPSDEDALGETHVLEKLMQREHDANQLLGDSASLMGEYTVNREEQSIRDVLREARSLDEVVRDPQQLLADARARAAAGGDGSHLLDDASLPADSAAPMTAESLSAGVMALLAMEKPADGGDTAKTVTATTTQAAPSTPSEDTAARSLYPEEIGYLTDALKEAFNNVPQDGPLAGGVSFNVEAEGIVSLVPPADLQRRFDFLPQDYVSYRKVNEKLLLATTLERGASQLRAARESGSEKSWPAAHYLGPLHPVAEWASDRALASMERQEIPAFEGDVDKLTVLVLGTLTSRNGQVVTRSFMAVSEGPLGLKAGTTSRGLSDPTAWLQDVGLTVDAINDGHAEVPEQTAELVAAAVSASTVQLGEVEATARADAEARAAAWSARAEAWDNDGGQMTITQLRTKSIIDGERALLADFVPERRLVRPLAVIIPKQSG